MDIDDAAGEHEPVWIPDPEQTATSYLAAFTRFVAGRTGVTHAGYDALWHWSVTDLAGFWSAVWDFFDLRSPTAPDFVLDDAPMPGTRWFGGTRLNYAEHALRANHQGDDGGQCAITTVREDGSVVRVTRDELRRQVGSLGAWLRRAGVRPGDRVVGYLPSTEHAVIAFLAAASVGAVWSACGQDYAASGAAARFAQLEPVVLFAGDGYPWMGTDRDRRDEVARLRAALPTLRRVVTVPNLGLPFPADGATTPWDETVGGDEPPDFEQLPFDAPLWVLFSSGTTGAPKGIVHGHGGVLLDHIRLLGLHLDLREGDGLFWYTTTNWMMWNLVVSGLLLRAEVLFYDGSPVYPGPGRLWELAAARRVAVLGVSPGYLLASAKAGLEPGRDLDLSGLRTLGCTGAPLPAVSYHWVRDHVGAHVQTASVSGGTDVVSAFVGGAPNVPVWPGEISVALLGVALDAWDAAGRPVVGKVGELVITRPMPSMPLYFWNDPDGTRYRDAYFSVYPGVWRHGDWITRTERGSFIISGRSDATLNRHGVRLGSADIYAVVDDVPAVRESLVIGIELADGGYWMPLFVVLEPGHALTGELRAEIAAAIRARVSPRHVPDEIIEVPALPHTRTGKKLEVPVKRLIQGTALDDVAGRDAIDDYAALAYFARYSRADAGKAG